MSQTYLCYWFSYHKTILSLNKNGKEGKIIIYSRLINILEKVKKLLWGEDSLHYTGCYFSTTHPNITIIRKFTNRIWIGLQFFKEEFRGYK